MGRLPPGCREAVHWQEIGPRNADDKDLLDYAMANESVLLTHDLDFGAILAHSGASGPSVLQVREQEVDPEVIGSFVLAAIEQCRDVLVSGALVTVNLRRAKARVLPITRSRAE